MCVCACICIFVYVWEMYARRPSSTLSPHLSPKDQLGSVSECCTHWLEATHLCPQFPQMLVTKVCNHAWLLGGGIKLKFSCLYSRLCRHWAILGHLSPKKSPFIINCPAVRQAPGQHQPSAYPVCIAIQSDVLSVILILSRHRYMY